MKLRKTLVAGGLTAALVLPTGALAQTTSESASSGASSNVSGSSNSSGTSQSGALLVIAIL